MVERFLPKEEVASSTLVYRSNNKTMIIIDIVKEYLLIFRFRYLPSRYSFKPSSKPEFSRVAIFLIGFNENNKFLEKLEELFRINNYIVHYPKYDTHSKVEICFESVRNFIIENDCKDVIILGHSKGGLIARYCLLDDHTKDHVSKVITIATPHKGTIFGKLRLFSLSEVSSKSKLLEFLDNDSNLRSKLFNFYPRVDNHVIPNRNLSLENATNNEINIVGHTRILESEDLLQEISKLI